MIKSHMGSVKVEGKRLMVLTDLAVAVQVIMEALVENGSNGESAKEEIIHAVNVGIHHASSGYEENHVEKKIQELIEKIVKNMGEEDVNRKRS
nr:MAG TPA: hypothetical protein [Caudoviricetes sp.]